MLGMVTPGGFLPIGHHIVSLIVHVVNFVLLHLAMTTTKKQFELRGWHTIGLFSLNLAWRQNMQDVYRCVSRLYLNNLQRY